MSEWTQYVSLINLIHAVCFRPDSACMLEQRSMARVPSPTHGTYVLL